MRKTEELVSAGRILKPYGKEGGLKIGLNSEIWDHILSGIEFIFIQVFGSKVPFRISQIREGSPPVVFFQDIETPEQARELNGMEIFFLKSDAAKAEQFKTTDPMKFLVGFEVKNSANGRVAGTIGSIDERGGQILATVINDSSNTEHLIPIHPDLIDRLEEAEKILHMNLPDGLLEL